MNDTLSINKANVMKTQFHISYQIDGGEKWYFGWRGTQAEIRERKATLLGSRRVTKIRISRLVEETLSEEST